MKPLPTKSQLDKFDGWDVPLTARAWSHSEQSLTRESNATSNAGSIAGAALGALAGGIVWLAFSLSVATDMGYLAVLLGILAGNGARLGGGARATAVSRFSALLGTVLGVLACKYLLFAYDFVANTRGAADYFSPGTWLAFRSVLPWWFGAFELFWCAIALIGAWMASRTGSSTTDPARTS